MIDTIMNRRNYRMTISEKIFDVLEKKSMTQKDFSTATNISQSTISDWKTKGTNPTSDKIMIICNVLNVSPYYLLSGVDSDVDKEKHLDYYIISNDSEEAILLERYAKLNKKEKNRLWGYIDALNHM